MKYLRAIWAYRYFIFSSIKTEFYTRFVRSRLGGLWILLHPLAQVAIYALVLSAVLSAKLPGIESQYAYAIYLMAGIASWTLFSEVFGRCLGVFVDNGNLLKKIAFPKIILPLILSGSALINNIVLLSAILVVFGLLQHPLSLSLLWLPILMIVNLCLAIGLGLILGIVNVFIRDVGQVISIVLQFWFWMTPIVYVPTIIPSPYREYLLANPVTPLVMAYQDILVYHKAPHLISLAYPAIMGMIALFIAGWMYFKANEEMADVL